ncbi:hypothetical protein [Ehrlichia canis]|uniref:Uncharacterized protein n=1 Tax=Ehrlichia canis (strain Jake) TaxID=269484 RepID=A0ACA6AY14_EHRCJ|nr:hypothetical protein [Ehrlichia canis]AAZ68769.1 hypothetical protein Ecaj_0737 [Ehrlichia canis str. Jake]
MGNLDIQKYVYLALFLLLLVILLMLAIYRYCVASEHDLQRQDVLVLSREYYNQLAGGYRQLKNDQSVMFVHNVRLAKTCEAVAEEKRNLEKKIKELGDDMSEVSVSMAVELNSLGVHPTVVSSMTSQMLSLQRRIYDVARSSPVSIVKADQGVQTEQQQASSALDQILASGLQCNTGGKVVH